MTPRTIMANGMPSSFPTIYLTGKRKDFFIDEVLHGKLINSITKVSVKKSTANIFRGKKRRKFSNFQTENKKIFSMLTPIISREVKLVFPSN